MFCTKAKKGYLKFLKLERKNSSLIATMSQNKPPLNKRYCRESTFMNR